MWTGPEDSQVQTKSGDQLTFSQVGSQAVRSLLAIEVHEMQHDIATAGILPTLLEAGSVDWATKNPPNIGFK